jgi:hypothetical protein
VDQFLYWLNSLCVLAQQFFVLAAQFLGLAPEGDLGGAGQGDLGGRGQTTFVQNSTGGKYI